MKIIFHGIQWIPFFPDLLLSAASLASWFILGHCDSLGGPVVKTARKALDNSDVTPVLKWVRREDEAQVREAFERALAVRAKGPDAKEMADTYFFETLVRLHRAGEGAPYSGLKPAGKLDPVIGLSDQSLETGDARELVEHLAEVVTAGIKARFERALETRERVDESVEAGREFVEAYVDYIHYVEKLFTDAKGHASHH